PYVVLEAMSCGAAIVATDVGGVREALGDCGLLVPARTPQAMAGAISFLLGNAAERERLGQMARARVLKHFTEKQFLNSYGSTYCDLLSCRPQEFPDKQSGRYPPGDPEEHQKALRMMEAVRDRRSGTRFYGYVCLGEIPSRKGQEISLTSRELEERARLWKHMGVAGIFLDEAG